MYKVILVDDEPVVAETVSSHIDWQAHGVQFAGAFSNAIDALQFIEEQPPDIVITDIRMPVMDGIELIRSIREQRLDIEVIVLSGYDEFEFAKQVMRFGVKCYLLKPFGDTEISEALRTVVASLDAKGKLLFDLEKSSLTEQLLFDRYVNYILRYDGAVLEPELDEFLPHSDILCICAGFSERVNVEQQVGRMLYDFWTDHKVSFAIAQINRNILVFCLINQPLEISVRTQWQTLIKNLTGQLPEMQEFCFGDTKQLQVMLFRTVGEYLDFSWITSAGVRREKRAAGFDEPALDQFIQLIDSHVGSERNDGMILRLSKIAGQLLRSIQNNDESTGFVQKIVQYINENIDDPNMSLQWCAHELVFLNEDYVGKCFSRQMGESFMAYLSRKRIERAKYLIINCDGEKIGNVAEQVGLGSNPYYFSKLFKKMTGYTPREYRAIHRQSKK